MSCWEYLEDTIIVLIEAITFNGLLSKHFVFNSFLYNSGSRCLKVFRVSGMQISVKKDLGWEMFYVIFYVFHRLFQQY